MFHLALAPPALELTWWAGRRNKGFAIVPCCVYHKQFPRRRLDGAPVTTYQQFVAYLTAKAPYRIKTATLDFEGKNLVLYALPPAHLAVDSPGPQ